MPSGRDLMLNWLLFGAVLSLGQPPANSAEQAGHLTISSADDSPPAEARCPKEAGCLESALPLPATTGIESAHLEDAVPVGFLGIDQPSASSPSPNPTSPPPAPPPSPSPAPAPDRWLLMKSLQGTWEGGFLDSERMSIYGWTEGSFTASTDQHSNLPLAFNYKANEFLLQQNWLRIDRAVVTSGTSEPTFGFRSDWILPGSDYRFTLARGIFNDQLTGDNGKPDLYGIDPIQFYMEGYFPTMAEGLDVKVGRFFAQYGVETNDAISNQLCSHAYTFIYDPFTHTGLLTTTKLSDAWSVQAGAVLGSDVFIDPADTPTFIGSVKWIGSGARDTVLLSVIAGSGRFNQVRNFNNPEVLDFIYTHQFSSRLAYNLETLYGYQTHVTGLGTTDWAGVLNYLTYTFGPRLSGTTRLEFFDDVQGQRTGFPGLYTESTCRALIQAAQGPHLPA